MTEVENRDKTPVNDYLMFKTAKYINDFFTRKYIVYVDKARNYQALLGWPTTPTSVSYVSNYLMVNFDIKVDYVK